MSETFSLSDYQIRIGNEELLKQIAAGGDHIFVDHGRGE